MMNAEIFEARWRGAVDFVRDIDLELKKGFGFVPLLGSGISARSGIPMGQEFTEYLAYVAHQTIEANWDIRSHGWPQAPSPADTESAKLWIRQRFEAICKDYQLEVLPKRQIGSAKPLNVESVRPAYNCEVEFGSFTQFLERPLVPDVLVEEQQRLRDQNLLQLIRKQSGRLQDDLFPLASYRLRQSPDFIIDCCIRSLFDWRVTLDFLARVDRRHGQLVLHDSPSPAVIDSFNAHITRDKQPNLTHKMVAHLVRSLRSRIILTTNFDSLLEESLRRVHFQVETVPVSSRSGLPDPLVVASQPTLIKLHGSLLETRADLSLDSEPSALECHNFSHYVAGISDETKYALLPCHLLVIGYSGRDQRTVALVKDLLNKQNDVKVFWVCQSQSDIDRLREIFTEEQYLCRLVCHRNSRPDLLIYDLYQAANLCLPPGGFSYDFTGRGVPRMVLSSRVPDIDSKLNAVKQALRDKPQTNIVKTLRKLGITNSRDTSDTYRRILSSESKEAVLSALHTENALVSRSPWYRVEPIVQSAGKFVVVEQPVGAVEAMRQVAEELEDKHHTSSVWIEMEDYPDVHSLVRDAIVQMGLRTGRFQLEHSSPLPDVFSAGFGKDHQTRLRQHLKDLIEYWKIDARHWVFIIFGGNHPGTSSHWSSAFTKWNQDEFAILDNACRTLAAAGFNVVYIPFDTLRSELACKRHRKLVASSKLLRSGKAPGTGRPKKHVDLYAFSLGAQPDEPRHDMRYQGAGTIDVPDSFPSLIDYVVDEWITPALNAPIESEAVVRIRFLYSLTLFRQSRHTSTLLNEAVCRCPFRFNWIGRDNDWIRKQRTSSWVDDLRRAGIFYDKPGGFHWTTHDVQTGIQWLIESCSFTAPPSGKKPTISWNMYDLRAREHLDIADWYFNAFLTNNHLVPALESLHHLFVAAMSSPEYKSPRRDRDKQQSEQTRQLQRSIFVAAVHQIIKLCRLSREALRYWLCDPKGCAMFQKGAVPESLASVGRDLFGEKNQTVDRLVSAVEHELLVLGAHVEFGDRPYEERAINVGDHTMIFPLSSIDQVRFRELGKSDPYTL